MTAPLDRIVDAGVGTTAGGAIKVLVVEDNELNRALINQLLTRHGYQVVNAENGAEGVTAFKREAPDLVLMDIQMPVMDGYEATRQIRALPSTRFVPIIFLTADNSQNSLVRCVEAGGDDFLTKPYTWVILQARINALMRIRNLYETVARQRDELLHHQQRLQREHGVAQKVFRNILHPETLERPNIKYLLSPMSLFNGDMLLVADNPNGNMHVLLGDFTGHGLAAAIGALPASDVFYQMTAKGYPVAAIVTELNSKLHAVLPTGMFLSACVLEINPVTRSASLWHGGLPDMLIYRAARGLYERHASNRLPLGILEPGRFDSRVDTVPLSEDDRIFVCSDGVTETVSGSGEMYGQARLDSVVQACSVAGDLFESIVDDLKTFRGGHAQADDMTLIEVRFADGNVRRAAPERLRDRVVTRSAGDWQASYVFDGRALAAVDPLPSIIQSVTELQGLDAHRQNLFTILAELYNNALDHGILGLDSALKSDPAGFARYYAERSARLAQLEDGRIRVTIQHRPDEGGGRIEIHVEDSGPGFDYEKLLSRSGENTGYSGRGIQLIRTLSEGIAYLDGGNHAVVNYLWRHDAGKAP